MAYSCAYMRSQYTGGIVVSSECVVGIAGSSEGVVGRYALACVVRTLLIIGN